MGLAVLPARLKNEMALLEKAMLENRDIRKDEALAKHADWADEVRRKYGRSDRRQYQRDNKGRNRSCILTCA